MASGPGRDAANRVSERTPTTQQVKADDGRRASRIRLFLFEQKSQHPEVVRKTEKQ